MPADPRRLINALDAIEAELDRLFPGLPAPTAEQRAGGGAFGSATMAFAQWLRFVFLPAAHERVASGDLPAESAVAAQAVREFDGIEAAGTLVGLLAEFDTLVTPG